MEEEGVSLGRSTTPKYPEVDVYPDLAWAYHAFWRLHNCRPEGMNGVLRIPVSEIESFSRIHRFQPERTLIFYTLIESMDQQFMAYRHELRMEQEGKAKAPKKLPAKDAFPTTRQLGTG